MATISNSVQGKWEEEEDAEEEALSLCDLPITLIDDEDQDQSRRDESRFNETNDEEEFDFRSWGGLFFQEPEMCAADEVFFQGQILPLRQSVSSEVPLLTKHDGKQFNCSESQSESLDHISQSESHSNSSRSSSVRSQNSSSSSSSTNTNTIATPTISKPKIRNQFHTCPSPRPQIRPSGPRTSFFGNQSRKSSAWEFFRLGVVPTPEIGLQDLKARSNTNKNCVSRNSSSSSNNSISNNNSTSNADNKSINMSSETPHHSSKSNHHGFKQFVGKGGGLFMNSCKCSVDAVRSDTVMIKGGTKSANKTESTMHAVKEKVGDLKMRQKKKQRQKQGKKVMSRRRTFEWLKELHANASHTDEEALLSNP